MPVAEFAGDVSWGYNPALPYAVTAEVNEDDPGSWEARGRSPLAHPRAVTGGPVPNLCQLLSR